MKSFFCILFCIFFCTNCAAEPIILGIDRVNEYSSFFKDKTVGLITNQTGITKDGLSSIEALKEQVKLTALFSPEHGLQGAEKEGALIDHSIDKTAGLKIFSLYGTSKKPSAEMLKGLDILCFDIQDIGTRYYTYIYTMAYAMQACKENGITFVVFDRPNPINGIDIEGNILQTDFASFVGLYPIPQRHGMTAGELALMFNKEFKIDCTLKVIPMKNWKRTSYFHELGLIWVPPSPNIPTEQTALVYSGIGIFEGTNLSVGRGTASPFLQIGAPFIDAEDLAKKLNKLKLEGVFFLPAYFIPAASTHIGKKCKGIQIAVTDIKKFKPVQTAFTILYKLQEEYPNSFSITGANHKYCGLNLLTGRNMVKDKKQPLTTILEKMKKEEHTFSKKRKPYLLY